MGSKFNLLNRKGQAGFIAWFFVIVVLFGAVVFFLVLNKAWGEIEPKLNTAITSSLDDTNYSNANVTEILNETGDTTRSFDGLTPFILIGLFAFVMIAAGGIMKSPIMIIVGIVVIGVLITLSVIYSNVYNELASSDELSSTRDDLPIGDALMRYLVYIIFIAAIAVTVMVLIRGGQSTI